MEGYTTKKRNVGETLRCLTLLVILAMLMLVPTGSWAQRGQDDGHDRNQDKFAQQLHHIKNIIVIYQENWSFDSLYGLFPGANGLRNSSLESLTQRDRLTGQPYSSQVGQPFDLVSGSTALTTPPQPTNNGKIDTRFPASLNTLLPFNLVAKANLQPSDKTGDIVHRFWHEQSQINHGKMNWFVTWSDNPGLVMSYFDASNLPEGKLAQQYTMDDNFFHSAYGGSFLNHQFLIAAQAPVYPNAATLIPGSIPTLDASGQLALNATTGKIVHDGNITPIGSASFGASGTFEKNYAVNTIFSVNLTPAGSNPTSAGLLPSQNDSNPADANRPYIANIGTRLDAKDVSWKWYSGGWDNALASSPSNPANGGATPPNAPVDPLFQWHHQAFAYFDTYAPWKNGQRNSASAAHLQDENNFFLDLQNGGLPAVSFIKPLGPNNEHPGYADLLTGQQHVADIVRAVQNSPYWEHSVIIVTYDEHGGRWDHVSPPVVDKWGPGARVPGIVIGPFAKRGFVDHTQYETDSILSLIEHRFSLEPLSLRDAQANPLTNSLDFDHEKEQDEDED